MLNTEQKNAKHQELLNTLKQEVEALFPMVSRNGKSISIASVHWDNAGIGMMNDLRAQKKAKLGEGSIQSRLLANVEFKDEEGKSLDSKQGYVLMTMPHVTSRNSYILEGSELQVVNQLRLRPGLYTALKGEAEVETQLNTTASGSYKVLLDRRTGVLRFKSGTDKKVPIFSVLQALGSSDSDIKSLLKDLYDVNFKAANPEKDTIKLLQSLNAYADVGTKMDNQIQIKEFLASKPLDPSVNKLTTGKEGIDKIDLHAVKEAVRKCVEVSNGAGEEDDKESLAFKSLHDVEDFIPERFRKSAPHLKRSIEFQMTNKETIAAVIPSTLFSKSVKDFMTSSQFTRYSDQNNPVDINAISSTITILGEGGIQNTQAITPQVRSVHPSHFGVLDVLHNQEGQQVGVTQHLSMGAKKVGNKIHLRVIDIKTGKPVEMSVEESMGYTVAFPDQYSGVGKGIPTVKGNLKEVKVRRGNKLLAVDPKEVEYLFNDAASFFGSSSNAVPFLPNNTANRVLMADKHIEQAVQLADPDKPLVQHRITGTGKGYLELFGEGLLISSPIDGTVQKVKKDAITINGKDGDVEVTIHDYYPLNSKTFLTDTPIVKVGDKVVKGQALVKNNFTKDKTLALGKNLSVAMIPYKGYNFEDGTVISQSAAMKLASVHKEEYRIEKGSDITVGLEDYIANYPKALQELPDGYREKYDNKGVVKKGEKVRKGDILIPALHEVSLRKTSLVDLHKKLLSNTYHDVSSVWDKDVEGVVMDVINDRKFVKVIVKSVEPAVVGDKLSAFAGAKGIITKILGPDEVYKDSNGKEIDVLFNPYGSVGRINPGFLLEAGAGKVAEKTGKTFYVDNFNTKHGSALKDVQDQLKAAGIDDEDTITNEHTGHKIPRVLVGPIHILKLKHKISGKFSARGATGSAYTTLEQPKKDVGESAQRIAPLSTFALLAGDANHFLDDAFRIKSQRNDDYWMALQLGHNLPAPKTPFVTEKLVAMLLAAGVNLNQTGDNITAGPMTDAEIRRISHGEIDSPGTLRAPNLTAMKGGLFDPDVTGGIGGSKFAHIKLSEPVVNPLMREAVISVGGFESGVELEKVLLHEAGVNEDGVVVETGGTRGIEGVIQKLKGVDLEKELEAAAEVASRSKATALNKANKKIRYIKALQSLKMRPEDAYVNKLVPVLPPKYRQITEMPDGSVSVSDANHGYREIIMINKQLDALKNMGYNDHSLRELRAALSDSVTANVGLGKFVTKGRQYRGLIEEINGANESKYGFFKSKVQSRPQDLSARSTIIPNPKLGMDHVGIPKKMAFKIYQPFVIRGLVQNGFTPMEAKKMLEDQSPEALSILQSEVESRPVLMNRAPELHKFNIMSYKPILIDGKAIETNPLTIISMGGDYDGDTVGIHVPVSEAARKEALTKLLPSRNLISPRSDTVMHMPVKETVLGIYLLTAPKGKAIKVANMAAAKKLVATGKIKENTAVLIGDTTHCVGQSIVNDVFPEELQPGLVTINAKQLDALVLDVSRLLDEDKTSAIISKLKDLGNHYVTYLGYAVSLRDLDFDYKKRDAVMQRMDVNTKRIGFEQAAVEANKELDALVAAATDNRFVEATVLSKSTGKAGAVRQMIASPVAMTDAKGEVIPFAVRKSFAEGHDLGSYLGTTPGARQGLVDKGITVASTGYLSRLLVNANIENKVSTNDCGTMDGLVMPVDGDVIYRYGAEGEYRNKLITPTILNNYKRNTKNKTIKVRSSLKCKASSGICAMCAGANPEGKKYNQGFNLGTQSAQSVGERATQVTLSSFHAGGALGGAKVGFGRIEELFKLPNVSKGRAVLSEESGRVEMIRKASSGGSFIVINGNDHFVPSELGVKVNLGDQVRAGQQLSVKGNVNPQDLLNATGDINLTRNVMIDELTKAYSGQKINRRVFENVLKPMTDRAKVTHQGDGAMLHNVYAGEIYQVNKLEEYNDSLKKKGLRPIKYEPILLGISAIPHQTNDFIGQMTHERLKDTIKGAASFSKGTHITKGHTISQLVLKQFGHVEDIKNPLKKLF